MSVAFYIVLDQEDTDFDTFVNGKALAKDAKKLDAVCKKLGLPKFDDFVAMSAEELSDMLGEDVELPEGNEGEKWFTADEGIGFVQSLFTHIQANPKDVKNAQAVLEDLAEYAEVFEQAKRIGAKWHLNLDI